ncbi:MAG: lactonase family protein [Leadbetterella sp.]|nr:lactonase family protein [Leadbetterella sp.]
MNWPRFIVLFLVSGKLAAQAPDFDAKGVFYFQDSDFNVESYTTQKVTKSGMDLVGVFTFPLKYGESRQPSEQNISNSVLDNHRIAAFRSDKKIAYVLETRGTLPRAARGTPLGELPPGSYVSVLKISDLHGIKPDYRFPVAENPTSVSLDPAYRYLAVSSMNTGNEIQIFELDDFGKPIRLLPQVLHLEGGAIQDLIWHPSKDYIVFLRKEDKEMGLIKVVRDKNHIIRLEQVGEMVKFDGSPMAGLFSKDGKSFFVLDQGDAANRISGKVFLARLSLEEDGKHILLTKADVGFNPLHISMNPGGDHLFVSNRGQESSSVSVLSIKGESLEVKAELPLEGILPTQVRFDKSGKNFSVGCFQSRTFGKPMGNIGFYRFSSGKIEKQPASILVPAGIHYLEVVY